jgi:hypothetical protein
MSVTIPLDVNDDKSVSKAIDTIVKENSRIDVNLFSEWDSNPSRIVMKSSVTVKIIDLVFMTDINLCFSVRH